MLYVFRVDIGETYIFETDLAFQDVKTLKSSIENEHGISPSKQILIISGGELLDDDAVQVCMKTRETCAGTEENPIYLLDKSHLERQRPLQISLTLNSVPALDNATIDQWLAMPSTYETIVQRADTAQNFHKYAQKIIQNCEQFIREQQAQYQGWMAVIANIEDTLSSFLLNRNSFDRLYQNYLSERSSYLSLFQSLPHTIEILHQLKLPHKLTTSIENSSGIHHKSTVSSTSSSVSLAATTSTNYLPQNENDIQTGGDISLFEWITAQLANMQIDDIINGCTHNIDECTEELFLSLNKEIDDLSKKISNHELKHMVGIEERFALLQNELTNAKCLQHEQKDCADYLVNQRQRFSSNLGNQRDWALIKDISGIHSQNLMEIGKRHQKLYEIEKKVRKSKQDIIDQLHRRFKNLMLLQRQLVDYDAKQSLYIHKLNRTRKTMSFLRQLDQAPNLYSSFLYECLRRKQYSTIFNQFSETIHRESKNVHKDEISKREQFIKQYEPHFLFNLLPALKILPTFFIKEPLPVLDANLPDLSLTELEQLFEQFPQIKQQNSVTTIVDPAINLASLIRCTQTFFEEEEDEEHGMRTTPLSVLVPSSTTMINGEITKQIPSPTNSSSRSTVVRSPSSSDVESPNEPSTQDPLERTVVPESKEEESITETSQNNNETFSEQEPVSLTKSSCNTPENEISPSTTSETTTTTTSNNEEEDDYIQCTLETVYTSTEMAVSPPHRPCASQQTDNDNTRAIANEFVSLKSEYEQSKKVQHDLISNYHETISKVITSLQQSNKAHEEQIEQLRSEIVNHLQDNETLKIQYDISEQLKQEVTSKCSTLKTDFDEFRRTSDIETSQIVKALQSDFEFEIEKVRSEHQEVLNEIENEQEKKRILRRTVDIQTDEQQTSDKQTSIILFNYQDQSTETNQIEFNNQSIQTSIDEHDETIMRRSVTKDQQIQFNLAIQRAVQNATGGQKKQIGQLEQQLADKRFKIIKLKECIKKLQNFYTLSSTPPAVASSVTNSMITSSTDDEQSLNKDEDINNNNNITTDETTSRTAFFKRSEPISMPSTFVVQSMLAAGNAASSPKTEQPMSSTVTNLLMDTCFKPSPSESSAAVELYTPFAASPPNHLTLPLSPQTPVAVSSLVSSPPSISSASRVSTPSANAPPQATPIAFFTVNRSDRVIIYFDATYQHYMIYTQLPTLHFIHSDCYELFNIQQKQNSSQQINMNNTSVMDSINADNGNNSVGSNHNIPTLINTSMINSTLIGNNGLNPSTTPLLGQVTDKEYCQAKKLNNRFNVPLGTKFYRVRVKPWKPTLTSSPN